MNHGANNPLWNYFSQVAGEHKVAKCKVCTKKLSYRTSITNLKTHLQNLHVLHFEKYVAENGGARKHKRIVQDDDQDSDRSDKDDNLYTEVLYLEQDPTQDESPEKPVAKPKIKLKKQHTEIRKRRTSSSSDEVPIKRTKKDNSDADDELAAFLKYIKFLLMKLPQDICSKIQADIVNLIMNAKTKYSNKIDSYMELQNHTIGNVITVNDLGNTSLGNGNYTISVASCSTKNDEIKSVSDCT